MITLQSILAALQDKTKLETYIVTFWFILIVMFNTAIYWIYIPVDNGAKMILTAITTYIYYNVLKTYTHTRTLLETETVPQDIQEPK